MTTNDSAPKKRAVYLRAEAKVLADRVEELQKAGMKAGQATIIRALMHGMPADQAFALSATLIAADATRDSSTAKPGGYKFPTIEVTDTEWGKIGTIVERLARAGMTATHNLVLRAMVGGAPKGAALQALMEKFKTEVPNKPRGLSKFRLGRKHKSDG